MKSRGRARRGRDAFLADFGADGLVGPIYAVHRDADTAFLVFGLDRGDEAISRARIVPEDDGRCRYDFDRPATPEECAWVREIGPPPQGRA